MPTVSKTQFKAQALQYFRQVEQTGQEVVITDRGRPVVDKYLKLRENDGERLCGRPGVRRNQQGGPSRGAHLGVEQSQGTG